MPTEYWRPGSRAEPVQSTTYRAIADAAEPRSSFPADTDLIIPRQTVPDSTAEAPVVMGRVLGLLGFAFLFTAGGVVLGRSIGPAALPLGLIGGFVALIALLFLKERAPLNLGLLYGFATLEGMVLSSLLETFVGLGLGSVVLQAAGLTAVITLAAGAYGATTRRDLSTWGGVLFAGLIGVVATSFAALVFQAPMISLVVAPVSAMLFTGFIVYDLNRGANARGISEGEQVLLAVNIYLDILNLFLALLRLLAAFASDD